MEIQANAFKKKAILRPAFRITKCPISAPAPASAAAGTAAACSSQIAKLEEVASVRRLGNELGAEGSYGQARDLPASALAVVVDARNRHMAQTKKQKQTQKAMG